MQFMRGWTLRSFILKTECYTTCFTTGNFVVSTIHITNKYLLLIKITFTYVKKKRFCKENFKRVAVILIINIHYLKKCVF